MNKYLRQLFTAVVALFVILGLSSTIIMAVRANALNNDPRNARSLYHQLGAYRGAILASDGTVMAKSEPVNDAFKYLRTYSNGPLYAPVTGFFSINQTADRGLKPPAACCSTVRPIHRSGSGPRPCSPALRIRARPSKPPSTPSCSRLPTIDSVRAMVRRWPSKSTPAVSSPW